MKKRFFPGLVVLLLFNVAAYSQHNHDHQGDQEKTTLKTEVFTVYGNCGMCEKTIEGSLKNIKAVSKADWDKETDLMTVSYHPDEVTLDDIKQKIADVGYDSDTHRAMDKVYSSLPGCCQYDRPEKN